MTRTERYKKQITDKEQLLTTLYEAQNIILDGGVESATFDTGTYGARQHVKNLDPSEIASMINQLESQIDRLERKCRGGGLVRIRTARYG